MISSLSSSTQSCHIADDFLYLISPVATFPLCNGSDMAERLRVLEHARH